MTVHNIHQMMTLTRNIRTAITEGRFPAFIIDFLHAYFPKCDYPTWGVNALTAGGFPECVVDAIPPQPKAVVVPKKKKEKKKSEKKKSEQTKKRAAQASSGPSKTSNQKAAKKA